MITYREANLSDTASLAALLGEIMACHGVPIPDGARQRAAIRAALASPSQTFVVAEEKQKVVAMCELVFTYSTWAAAPVCEVQDVIVSSTHRRRGIGRQLIYEAEQIARQRGCTHLFLLAEYWNLEAHKFYRSLGLAEKTCLYFEQDLRHRSR